MLVFITLKTGVKAKSEIEIFLLTFNWRKKVNYRCKEREFFSKNPIKVFFSYYRPHLKIFLLDMICAVLISFIDIAFPVVSKFTIDSIIPGRDFKKFTVLIA